MDTLIGTSIGGYTLVQVLGSGGMGTVYLAEDPAIGQQVAIKVVRTDPADFPDLSSATMAAERFKQEARAVASLDHLHILPLYRYGEEETSSGKRAYIIMQYRPEGSLWDWLRRRAGLLSGQSLITASTLPGTLNGSWPLSLEETSNYLQQAASALQYAHEHGIIHRDVKPANFLLRIDNGNTVHLLLSDFGLAKLFSSSSATSHILGTPTYMAPEQFDGVAGPESDQYALAVMIYYFLAGRPPFEGEPMRLMNQHLTAEPPPITRFNAAFPQGIVPVFSRALAKKPQDRYPSTAAFAEAFEQASQDTRVNMQPFFSLPALAQTNRTPQGKPVGAGAVWTWGGDARIAPGITTPASPSRPPGYPPALTRVGAGVAGTRGGDARIAPVILPGKPEQVGRRKALGWILGGAAVIAVGAGAGIYVYSRFAKPANALYVLRGHTGTVTSVSWSPDGTQLVSGSRDKTVKLWLIASGNNTLTYSGHHAAVLSVAWNPGGHFLASGGEDRSVQVWDTQGNALYTFAGLGVAVSSVIWYPDEKRLFAGTLGNGAHEIVLETRTVMGSPIKASIHALAFSPDRRFLAAALHSGVVAIASLQETPHKFVLHHIHSAPVLALAWSPDSTMLASGSADATAKVWDAATATVKHTLLHSNSVNGVAWDPAGTGRLATACSDNSVNIWDVNSSARTTYSGHGSSVTSVAWGASGLASGSADTDIIIWQV